MHILTKKSDIICENVCAVCILCQAQLRTKAPACTKNVATKIVQVLTHLLSTGCSEMMMMMMAQQSSPAMEEQ